MMYNRGGWTRDHCRIPATTPTNIVRIGALRIDYLPRENVDPIAGTTKLRSVSYTRHVTRKRIHWSTWTVDYVATI